MWYRARVLGWASYDDTFALTPYADFFATPVAVRGHEGLIHPGSPDPAERWIPDLLLPAAPFKVRENATQGLWLTVYAAPDATPGLYCGIVEVRENGDTMASIPRSRYSSGGGVLLYPGAEHVLPSIRLAMKGVVRP